MKTYINLRPAEFQSEHPFADPINKIFFKNLFLKKEDLVGGQLLDDAIQEVNTLFLLLKDVSEIEEICQVVNQARYDFRKRYGFDEKSCQKKEVACVKKFQNSFEKILSRMI
jgi:hypothetical protein